MQIIRTPAEMQAACRTLRTPGQTLALVPTMGALHAGHLSLVAAARAECTHIAASIFVNPTQFGPNEDYTTYPRTFDEDCAQLEAAGVDLLFAPSADAMYPPSNTTLIDPGPIATRLDGASRPGHFRGVATIVTRLFHIVQPDRAYFGQKDAAQVAVLRSITRDLNLPVEIAVCPIIREPDGLALSSRNRYLSPTERTRALILHRALTAAAALAAAPPQNCHPEQSEGPASPSIHPTHCHPERSAAKSKDLRLDPPQHRHPEQSEGPASPSIHPTHCHPERSAAKSKDLRLDPPQHRHPEQSEGPASPSIHPTHCHPERSAAKSKDLRLAMLEVLSTDPTLRLDYAAIVDPDTLLPIPDTSQPTLIAIAAWIGQTRLIDNLLLPPT